LERERHKEEQRQRLEELRLLAEQKRSREEQEDKHQLSEAEALAARVQMIEVEVARRQALKERFASVPPMATVEFHTRDSVLASVPVYGEMVNDATGPFPYIEWVSKVAGRHLSPVMGYATANPGTTTPESPPPPSTAYTDTGHSWDNDSAAVALLDSTLPRKETPLYQEYILPKSTDCLAMALGELLSLHDTPKMRAVRAEFKRDLLPLLNQATVSAKLAEFISRLVLFSYNINDYKTQTFLSKRWARPPFESPTLLPHHHLLTL